jgi:hypothetical protein
VGTETSENTASVRLRPSFVEVSETSKDRPVWLLPEENGNAFRAALDGTSFVSRTVNELAGYERTALEKNDTALFLHGELGPVRVNDVSYETFAISTPATRRYVWYEQPNTSSAVSFDELTPAEQSLLQEVVDSGAESREQASERLVGEAIVSGLSGQVVSYEDRTYEIRTQYVETPDWPPSGMNVGYRTEMSSGAGGRLLRTTPPVSTSFLTDALDGGVSVSPDDERFGAVKHENPVLLSLTSAWELQW